MSTISVSSLAYSFSYALVYSLLQGLLIYSLVWALQKALQGAGARTRYNLSLGGLLAMFAWFADTWASQYNKLSGVTVYITQTGAGETMTEMSQPLTTSAAAPARFDIFKAWLPAIAEYVPYIIAAYCIGLLFMLLRFSVNLTQLKSLSHEGVATPTDDYLHFVKKWQLQMGISREIKLLLSHKVNVPMMLGSLKPVILLPVATISHLSTEQVEAILMHELAHIKRHDYLFNLLQTVVETILFFNPFVWLTSAIIRREREHCCDDLVLSCAADPLHYATALTILEDSRINHNSLALAATGNKNQLFNRIKRIMEMKKENSLHSRYSLLAVAVVTTLFIASVMAFTPSLAQKADTGKQTPQKKTTTSKTVTTDANGKKKVVVKTKSDGKTTEDEDNNSGNLQIKIVTDDDGDVTTANVMLIDDDQDFIDSKRARRKEIIVAKGGNGTAKTIVINKAELNRELDEARKELEDVNWDEIGAEIAQALASVEKELHMEEMGKEIRVEIKKELEKSKAALKDAKRDIEKSKREMAQSKKEIAYAHAITDGKSRATAKAGDAEITTDSEKIEDMLDKMEQDGLINREKKYTIEKEQDELYINGNKQSAKVYDKYSRYMKGKQVIIKGHKGSLNINVSN